jgi:mannose-6-phosphate isomerase-like protein (cupin superfamily)
MPQLAPHLPRCLENPVTGDETEILNSPLAGEAGPLIFRTRLAPGAAGSPLHSHRSIDETFEVESGALEMEAGAKGALTTLTPGQAIALPAGRLHSFRNRLNEPTVFVSTCTPGEGFEKFLRTFYVLAAAGETNAGGMPADPLALALALGFADLVIADLPAAFQMPLLAGLRSFARATGVEAGLNRFWPPAVVSGVV